MKKSVTFLRLLIAAMMLVLAVPASVSAMGFTLKFHANGGHFVDPENGDNLGDLWTYGSEIELDSGAMTRHSIDMNVLGMAELWQYLSPTSKVLKKGPGLQRDGYVIAGWYKDKGLTKKAFSDHAGSIPAVSNYYAKWVKATDANTYKVTFDFNGEEIYPGSDVAKGVSKVTMRVAKGEPVLEQRERAMRSAPRSADLKYWSYDKAGNKPVNSPGAVTPKGNMTFYAQYTAKSGVSVIALTQHQVTMKPGQSLTLGLKYPKILLNKRLFWSGGSDAINVDQNGVVTVDKDFDPGTKDAEVTIAVHEYAHENGSSDQCKIIVKSKKRNLTVLNLQDTEAVSPVSKKIGAKITLKADKAYEGRAFDYWEFSRNVKFTNGSSGNASSSKTVSFYMPDGDLRVQAHDKPLTVKGASFSKKTVKMKPGQKKTLVLKLKPSGASYKSLSWWSTNGNVAEVSSKGVVTAKGGGTCRISATVDGKYKAVCTIKVPEVKAKKASFQKKKLTLKLKKKKTYKLKVKLKPAGSTYTMLSWYSNNGRVALVSAEGVVTAVGKGKCTISCTVTTPSGKKLKAKCKVTVK